MRAFVDGTVGIKTSPMVLYVVCHGCYKKNYQTRDTVHNECNQEGKEIDFMLHPKDACWIQNQQVVETPYVLAKCE